MYELKSAVYSLPPSTYCLLGERYKSDKIILPFILLASVIPKLAVHMYPIIDES